MLMGSGDVGDEFTMRTETCSKYPILEYKRVVEVEDGSINGEVKGAEKNVDGGHMEDRIRLKFS